MSQVKANVIRIVKGLPPEEPKNLVELKPDEVVVQKLYLVKPEPSDDASGFANGGVVEGSKILADDAAGASGDKKPLKPFVRFEMAFGEHGYICPRVHSTLVSWIGRGLPCPKITR